ncbi:hypothetical protein EDB80DRAFT_594099 [Ilyonectria destructans]|nr:hypothetical protein EDB80DRAFT_594099 [Ilyonectria destructans]
MRRGSSELSGEAAQQVTKKRKLDHPSRPPPHLWDNLSQLVLTKGALRELDRRNTAEPHLQLRPGHRYRRPCTRRVAAARRNARPLSAQEFLQQSSPTDRAQLRRFASHGGPNLEYLRGVRKLPVLHTLDADSNVRSRLNAAAISSSPGQVSP